MLLIFSVKNKKSKKKVKSKITTSKKEKILRNFLLFTVTVMNAVTGVESLNEAKQVISRINNDIPDSSKSKKFSESAKEILSLIAKNNKTDVFSLLLLMYQIFDRIKESYLVILGRDKLTTAELKKMNIDSVIQNALSRGMNFLIKNNSFKKI